MARRAERHREARDHPRRTSLFVLFVAFLAVLGAVVGASRYYRGCQLPVEGTGKVSFDVPEGATADSVVSDLAGAGLIRCGGFVGNLMIRGTGKATSLLAGKYTLHQGMTLDEIVAVLSTPPPKVPTVDILIPPGYRLTQIADAVQKALGIKPERFLAVAQSGRFSLAPYLPKGTKTVEGFVFPDTYRFRKHGTTSKDVIETGARPVRREGEGPALGEREEAGGHPVPDRGHRLDDRTRGEDRRRPREDRRRDLQPAEAGHDPGHRRHGRLHRPGSLERPDRARTSPSTAPTTPG